VRWNTKVTSAINLTQNNTNIMAKISEYIGQLLNEVINVELHTTSMNQEDGFFLSRLWKPVVYSLKEENRSSSRMLEHCLPEVTDPLPQYWCPHCSLIGYQYHFSILLHLLSHCKDGGSTSL
jgi:hypothetical protein